jgi:hypothetical protein
MRRLASVAATVIALCVVSWAQTSMSPAMQNAPARKTPLSEYAGAWIGIFQGHTWFTIRLMQRGDQLVGMLQRPNDVQFDDQGEVKNVSDEKWAARIESAQLNGDGLLLTVKDPGTEKTDRYLVRLTSDTTAEVKIVAMPMPPGIPQPKPWRLTKVPANAITPPR